MRFVKTCLIALHVAASSVQVVQAQELKTQPIPFSVWLDFKAIANTDAARPSFPIWLESVIIDSPKTIDDTSAKTTIRLRIRKFPGLADQVMLRVFFDDVKGSGPVVSAWSELGSRRLAPTRLGQGLGLPTSETVAIDMDGVHYIDIDVPGNGSSVRGAFLSSLRKVELLQALDFARSTAVADPFCGSPAAEPGPNDTYLFGRVRATLQGEAEPLQPESALTYDFQLDSQPMLAVLTFEMLNPDVAAPPSVVLSGRDLGPVALLLPDLADPGYEGTVVSAQSDVRFRYTGWVRCQKIVAGSNLQVGVNSAVIALGKGPGATAIRAVELQLKYTANSSDALAPLR
jgi:hypothetical protein